MSTSTALRRSDSAWDDSSVIGRLQSGRQATWAIVQSVFPVRIYARLRRRGLSQQDADDVTVEVMKNAYAGIRSFECRDEGSFVGWISRIATRCLADFYRKKGKQLAEAAGGSSMVAILREVPAKGEADEFFRDIGETAFVEASLNAIKPLLTRREYQILYDVCVLKCKNPEIATRLGIKENTVRMTRMRAMRKLTEHFGIEVA